jgi:hypothetical protein
LGERGAGGATRRCATLRAVIARRIAHAACHQ